MFPRLLEYPTAKSIVICGDIHEDFHALVYKLCVRYGMTDTLLIVAGDCGFGFDKPRYYERVYNEDAGRLRKANNWFYGHFHQSGTVFVDGVRFRMLDIVSFPRLKPGSMPRALRLSKRLRLTRLSKAACRRTTLVENT